MIRRRGAHFTLEKGRLQLNNGKATEWFKKVREAQHSGGIDRKNEDKQRMGKKSAGKNCSR